MEFNYKIQTYYKDLFEFIKECVNDYDVLLIAIELLKIASGRLENDINDISINEEYKRFLTIIKELEDIKNKYTKK